MFDLHRPDCVVGEDLLPLELHLEEAVGDSRVGAHVLGPVHVALAPAALLRIQSAALGQSQGFVTSFLGSSTGWWAGTPATLLPGKKEIAKGTSKKINTEPRGLT